MEASNFASTGSARPPLQLTLLRTPATGADGIPLCAGRVDIESAAIGEPPIESVVTKPKGEVTPGPGARRSSYLTAAASTAVAATATPHTTAAKNAEIFLMGCVMTRYAPGPGDSVLYW